MPSLKQTRTLESIALDALAKAVSQKAREAAGASTQVNVAGLHEYLYTGLPRVLWDKVTTRLLSQVIQCLRKRGYNHDNVFNTSKSIILGIICPRIGFLDLSDFPSYALRILSCNIQTFQELHTLIIEKNFPCDAVKSLPIGLSFLTRLVNFDMEDKCTDSIIETLGSCCYTTIRRINVNCSEEITDASFKALIKCHMLQDLSIINTLMTSKGLIQFLQTRQQHKQTDEETKDLLQVGVGSFRSWVISTEQLNEIAISCPTLKKLDISSCRGDLEALANLTTLEVLQISWCNLTQVHNDLDGFIRLRGGNLIELVLRKKGHINLTCVMNHCINIKRLVVLTGSADGDPQNAAKTFQNLEKLVLSCKISSSTCEGILHACVNVQHLNLCGIKGEGSGELITNEFIQRLLCRNPLRKLKSFGTSSVDLTMKSVEALITHCPLLQELKLTRCRSITYAEINLLRRKTAANNQDLKINYVE